MKPSGRTCRQEATDELARRDGHRPLLALVGIVLVAERHLAVPVPEQATVGNRHPVRVASQILQHATRVVKRPLGVDHPLALGRGVEITLEGTRVGQWLKFTEELQFFALERLQ